MTTAHDDTAQNWRDLADQLTPEQITELEYFEREQIPPGLNEPHHHLRYARKLVELNIARAVFADIAPPPDAIDDVDDWTDWGNGEYQRMYTAWTRRAGMVSVDIFGYQTSNGHVDRSIVDSSGEEPMTAEQARQRAAALLEAADELDRLND